MANYHPSISFLYSPSCVCIYICIYIYVNVYICIRICMHMHHVIFVHFVCICMLFIHVLCVCVLFMVGL